MNYEFFMPNTAVLTNKNAGLGTASQLQSRKSQGTSFTCYFVCWECHVHSQGIFLSLIPNVCLSLYAWYMCRSRPRGYSLLNLMKICNICVTELMNQQFKKLNKLAKQSFIFWLLMHFIIKFFAGFRRSNYLKSTLIALKLIVDYFIARSQPPIFLKFFVL